jgi:DNA modification methylase
MEIYKTQLGKLIHGDCLEVMAKGSEKSIDMILCDLPYGTTACKWDSIIPLDLLWKQYNRIIKEKRVIALSSTQPFTTQLINSNLENFKYCWYWKQVLSDIKEEKDKFHPTQKPVELFEYLIKTYTNEGDLVLDNCAGSGTTAIACENLNRRYICIEKDDNYFQIGKERVIKHIEEKSKKGENNVEINAGAV